MSAKVSSSTALPIAYLAVRTLIVVNWLWGVAIIGLLVAAPTRQWIMTSLALTPSPQADRVVTGFRVIAGIGLITIPLNYAILKRLLSMVETVRAGDPFVAANAYRLQSIAWTLLVLQLISVVIGRIARSVSTPGHMIHLNAGFSVTGWLAVILTFLLARVFAAGTLMREDLEWTV